MVVSARRFLLLHLASSGPGSKLHMNGSPLIIYSVSGGGKLVALSTLGLFMYVYYTLSDPVGDQ
jgi:hypothetical protein